MGIGMRLSMAIDKLKMWNVIYRPRSESMRDVHVPWIVGHAFAYMCHDRNRQHMRPMLAYRLKHATGWRREYAIAAARTWCKPWWRVDKWTATWRAGGNAPRYWPWWRVDLWARGWIVMQTWWALLRMTQRSALMRRLMPGIAGPRRLSRPYKMAT